MIKIERIFSARALSVILFFSATVSVFAQEPKKVFIGEAFDYNSSILGEERSIYVYTPAGYQSSGERYPVFYVLDGAEHFVHVTGIVHYLSGVGRIPPMILVAIPNTARTHDLTPSYNSDFPSSGGGPDFLRFLSEELIPYIDSAYRTHPYRILFGHSLAGTFAIYALLNKPYLFGAYISASPSIGWDNGLVIDQAKSFFKKHSRLKKFFYLTLGNEGDIKAALFEDFTNIIRRTRPKDFDWEYRYMENETHASIPHRSIYDGLELLYSDWMVNIETAAAGLDAVKKHYENRSEKFGYSTPIPENFLNNLGYEFLYINNLEEALKIFKYNVEKYPDSPNVYDSYGEALEKDNQLEKALENYRIAYTKARETNYPSEGVFRQNFDRVRGMLEGDN